MNASSRTNEPPLRLRLLALCFNPAWQKTLFFDRLTPGRVNRARELRETGGGKGVNLARALRVVGVDVTVAAFLGGATGAALDAELRGDGIGVLGVNVSGATRTCTTLLDGSATGATELIEPSAAIAPTEVAAMRAALLPAVPEFSGIAIAGTYPPGVPGSLYAEVARAAADAGVPVLLDGYRGVDDVLRIGIDILKINADELREMAGCADVAAAARACFERYPVGSIAVTDGPRPAFLFRRDGACRFDQTDPDGLVNSIGAGDCASAILLLSLARCARAGGPDLKTLCEGFRDALAAATASCLTAVPSLFAPERAAELRHGIVARPIAFP